MNITCPNEERLKLLIREAFDELAGSDSARLEKIGTRIGKQAQSTKPRWSNKQHWLFWLLFGASMTAAAWWGTENLLTNQSISPATPAHPLVSEPIANDHSNKAVPADKKDTDLKSGNEQQGGPVIYRREQY